ncbi:putative reverse transcriptase domain-containing protein [Tanacetum coccineum]|uniref:Reverse transcriptase domain-containing protein n=1 Tax=Tanacetum coccineum TaxID=301880 RepID=A0ABQ4XZY0_9ASTR
MRRKGRETGNALDAVIQIDSLAIVQNQLATKIKRPSLEVLGAIAKMTPKTKLMMKLVSWLNRQMRDLLEKEVLELNEKIKKLERGKEIDIAIGSCILSIQCKCMDYYVTDMRYMLHVMGCDIVVLPSQEDYLRLAMPSHFYKKFRWGTAFATGLKRFTEPATRLRMKRTNPRTRVPIGLYPCHIKEKMTIKEVEGESVMEWKTKVATKEGVVIHFRNMVRPTHQNPTPEASPEPNPDIATIIVQQLQNIIPRVVTQVTANVNNGNGGNGNGGNDGCSYKTFITCNLKEFDGKGGAVALTRFIEKMESVFENSGCTANQRVRGREAAIGMSWNDFKALLVEEFCPSNEMEKLENEFWNHTMVGANHVAYTDRFHELAKCHTPRWGMDGIRVRGRGGVERVMVAGRWLRWRGNHGGGDVYGGGVVVMRLWVMMVVDLWCGSDDGWLKSGQNLAGKRILTDEVVRCGTLTKVNDKRKEMEESSKQGSTWKDNKKSKTGSGFVATSLNHLCFDYPKWKQATGQARNPLALEGNKNTRNNGNQARGKAFNGNEIEALQDPKVVTGSFSLNNQFATAIEIADGKSVEVDRVIRDCKLELGNSLFTIDLIPLGHGCFDVIVGMDWLSKNKAIYVVEKIYNLPQTATQAVRNTNVIKPGMYRIASSTTQTRAPQLNQTSRNTNPRVSTSTGVAHKTNVSRPQPRSNQMKDKVMPNTSHVKTSNVNAVCATCGKCVFNSNHDACVSKFLKDVNARTKKPNVVPICRILVILRSSKNKSEMWVGMLEKNLDGIMDECIK